MGSSGSLCQPQQKSKTEPEVVPIVMSPIKQRIYPLNLDLNQLEHHDSFRMDVLSNTPGSVTKKMKFREKNVSFAAIAPELRHEQYIPSERSNSESNEIVKKIAHIPFFELISYDTLRELSSHFRVKYYKTGAFVFQSGDYVDCFYLVKSGQFCKYDVVDDERSREFIRHFGATFLCYGQTVKTNLVCKHHGELFVINSVTYQRIILDSSIAHQQKQINFIDNVPILSPLNQEQRLAVANELKVQYYKDGDIIIQQGSTGDAFYIIEEGVVSVMERRIVKGNTTSKEVYVHLVDRKAGDYFGERSLIKDEPRNADVIAKGDVKCLVLYRKEFNELLGSLVQLLDQNNIVRILQSSSIFEELSQHSLFEIACSLIQESYKANDVIVKQGLPSQKFFIIREGRVQLLEKMRNGSDKIVGEKLSGEFFGENTLVSNDTIEYTAKALDDCTLLVLSRSTFSTMISSVKSNIIQTLSVRSKSIHLSLNQLQKVTVLGVGAFGTVTMVRNIQNGMTYALKEMLKANIVLKKQQNFVLNECQILKQINHPFVVNLVSTFQDELSVYFLIELCLGGELYSLMKEVVNSKPDRSGNLPGCFDISFSKFYVANILLALFYIHSLGICHRDLKPENLLFTNEGYIKLADFGFAKLVKDSRTYSLCGTPEYTAPEVYQRRGYNISVDYWAVGILLYEMIAGASPFQTNSENPWDCYLEISRYVTSYPNVILPDIFSNDLKNIVISLLNPNPFKRLGARQGGVAEIKQHKFYQGFQWDELSKMSLPAPFKPNVSSILDASFFTDTMEPLKASEGFNPLEYDMSWVDNFL